MFDQVGQLLATLANLGASSTRFQQQLANFQAMLARSMFSRIGCRQDGCQRGPGNSSRISTDLVFECRLTIFLCRKRLTSATRLPLWVATDRRHLVYQIPHIELCNISRLSPKSAHGAACSCRRVRRATIYKLALVGQAAHCTPKFATPREPPTESPIAR